MWLFYALENYRKARDYLELLPEKSRPEIYSESTEKIDKLSKELEERRKKLMFSAEQAREYNQLDKAKDLYRQVILMFPKHRDPRALEAKKKLEKIR